MTQPPEPPGGTPAVPGEDEPDWRFVQEKGVSFPVDPLADADYWQSRLRVSMDYLESTLLESKNEMSAGLFQKSFRTMRRLSLAAADLMTIIYRRHLGATDSDVRSLQLTIQRVINRGQPPIMHESQDPNEIEQIALQTEGAEQAVLADWLVQIGAPDETKTEFKIAGLHNIAERAEKLARNIGLQAVAEGQMSQVKLAKLLGVHALTVHRWIKEQQEQSKQ